MNLSGNRTTNGLVIFRAVSQLTERLEQATLDSSHALFGQSVIVGVYRHCQGPAPDTLHNRDVNSTSPVKP